MAATKVWKRFQRVERVALIILCVVMLATLGIGGGLIFDSFSGSVKGGAMTIEGKRIDVPAAAYRSFFDRHANTLPLSQRLFGSPGRDGRKLFSVSVLIPPEREGRRGPIDEQIGQRWILRELAHQAGIRTSRDDLVRFVRETFIDPDTGQFMGSEAYERLLSQYGTSPLEMEAVITDLLTIQEYIEAELGDRAVPSNAQLVEEYLSDERQQRLRVEYTWAELAAFEDEIGEDAVTDEEIQSYYDENKERDYRVEEKRSAQIAWVHVSKVTDAMYEDLLDRFGDDESLRPTFEEGYEYFRSRSRIDAFTNVALRTLDLVRKKREGTPAEAGKDGGADDGEAEEEAAAEEENGEGDGTEESADGDGTGEGSPDEEPGDEEPGDEDPGNEDPGNEDPGDEEPGDEEPGDEEPGDEEPGDEEPGGETEEPDDDGPRLPPEDAPTADVYRDYWKDYVLKELFLRNLATRVLEEARDTGEDFEKVATKYGMELEKTAALPRSSLENHASFGTLDLAKALFEMPAEETGGFVSRVLETTMESRDFLRRGFQVAQLLTVQPETVEPLDDDLKASIVEVLHRQEVEEHAREEMASLAEETLEDRSFAEVLEDKGLPRVELDPFSRETPRPMFPRPPGSDATEEEKSQYEARRDAIARESLVRQRAPRAFGGGSSFSDPIVDGESDSVILIHRLESLDPDPIEMTEQQRQSYARSWLFEQLEHARTAFSYESLRERYEFQPPQGF